jgi:PAS domain S-box-containing protein
VTATVRGTPLRVVIVEDRPDDAELLAGELTRAGFAPEWQRVESLAEYRAALDSHPDVVLADYSLPQFGALDALAQAGLAGDVPVIVVSGVMDEETCVESLRRGAADYLLKDRLVRLGPAVERVLAQRHLRTVTTRAEQVAQESERRFRAAFDQAPIGMAVTTGDGRFIDANPALCRLLGCEPVMLLGESFEPYVHPDDRAAFAEHTRGLRAGEPIAPNLELRLVNPAGQVTWVTYSAALVTDGSPANGSNDQLIRQVQDITERRRDTAILQGMIDNAPAMLYLRGTDGTFLVVNSALEKLTGRTRAELTGPDGQRLLPRALAVELDGRDRLCRRADRVVVDEETIGGATYLSIRYPLPDHSGTPFAIGAMYTDITEQKRIQAELASAHSELQHHTAELGRLNTELSELDRMKSELVATVSHELRTPLTSIRGYTELLADAAPGTLPPTERRMVEIIDRNGQRLLALVEDLLTFSRIDSGTFSLMVEDVHLAGVLDTVCTSVAPSLPPTLELNIRVAGELGKVRGDAAQLERAVLNLVSNAVKFSPDGGTITVGARRDGNRVTIVVADTGIGMSREEQGRLFQRFYRTPTAQKRQIQGTGLGLALVKGIVDKHGGTVDLTSAPGRGTTVTVTLPAS